MKNILRVREKGRESANDLFEYLLIYYNAQAWLKGTRHYG
jgi:hypothetical protein